MSKDYYAILGIEKTATESEIKLAFRNKAKQLHPDINKEIASKTSFQELNEAYSVLSDPESRRKYDEGELESGEISFTWEEVEQILKQREEQRRQNQKYSDEFGYPGETQYPPTNYEANSRVAMMINLFILLFAFSFVLDFFVFKDNGSEPILSKNTIIKRMKKGPMQSWHELKTASVTFYISYEKPSPNIGDMVETKRSMFYGNHKYRVNNSGNFQRADDLPMVTYIMALISLLISYFGYSKFSNAEQKFNSAIIAGFLCLAMLVMLLYPR